MSDDGTKIDREAAEAIKRIHLQQTLDGKLNKAYAAEGAGVLLMPILLAVVGLIAWGLTSLGLEGPAMIFVGVPVLIGLGVLVLALTRKR